MDVVADRSVAPHLAPFTARRVRRRLLWAVMVVLFVQVIISPPVLAAAADLAERLDINSATAGELAERLPGIGQVKGQAIVDWRKVNGAFDSVDALIEVPGIGPKTLERLRPLIVVGGEIGEAADARERATVLAVRRIVERAHRVARDPAVR